MSKTGNYIGGHTVLTPRNYEQMLQADATRARKRAARAQLEFDRQREYDAEHRRKLFENLNYLCWRDTHKHQIPRQKKPSRRRKQTC